MKLIVAAIAIIVTAAAAIIIAANAPARLGKELLRHHQPTTHNP